MSEVDHKKLKGEIKKVKYRCNLILSKTPEPSLISVETLLDEIDQLAQEIESLMKKCVVKKHSVKHEMANAVSDNEEITLVRNNFFELWKLEGALYRLQKELFTYLLEKNTVREANEAHLKLDLNLTLKEPLPGNDSERLSKRLNLEYPYDWSNSKMDLNTLVIKVLRQYRFNDVLTMSKHLGSCQLKSVAKKIYGEHIPNRLSQILRSIGRAEKRVRARKLGFANARLSNLKSTPELDAVVERFIDGEISLEEAFTDGKIRRYFEFEIVVALPKGAKHEDFLEGFEKHCPDAFCDIVALDRIALKFERSAISREEAINESLQEINEIIPNAKIISVK